MKIEIRPLVRPISLRDYAAEYGDEMIWVWVNPPRQLRMEHFSIVQDFQVVADARAAIAAELEETLKQAEKDGVEPPEPDPDIEERIDQAGQQLDELSTQLYGWFATILSQHEDEDTHWTTDEVVELVEVCLDSDPRLWSWIQDRLWELITEHREGIKKK